MPFASDFKFVMSSLRNALGVPSTRLPIDGTTFVSYVIPPLVCYFVAAMLAVTPQTRILQLSFCPLVALLAFRAALSVDLSFGEIGLKLSNPSFVCLMLHIASRPLCWAIAKGPLVRHLRPANGSPSIIMDAFDLAANFRGHGWDWSYYQSYVPRETRPTNHAAFVLYASFSVVAHALISSVFHRATVALVPIGVGSNPQRQTIFDDTLPVLVQYLRANLVSIFTATWIYASFQAIYDLFTILGILIFRQDPIQWPPAFDAPWRATSLINFWGRRWHQFFRHTFLLLGYPLSLVLGRPGIVIGAFLASVLLHYVVLVALDSQVEIWWMLAGFGMMVPGVFAERAFLRLTGKRVDGVLGWVWAMSWLLIWGTVIVEGFARGGIFVCSSLFSSASPLRTQVERLTVDFDAWLHTL